MGKKRIRKSACGTSNDIEAIMQELTARTEIYWLNRMLNIMVARIQWNNLPKEIDERYLEWILNTGGIGVGFRYDNELCFMKSALEAISISIMFLKCERLMRLRVCTLN